MAADTYVQYVKYTQKYKDKKAAEMHGKIID